MTGIMQIGSLVHSQTNGLLVRARDRGLELDGQSHDDGSCARVGRID